MRSKKAPQRLTNPDPIYQSQLVTKLINVIMKEGKKTAAQKHVYQTLELLKAQTNQDPVGVLRQVIDSVKPTMEVRSRRVGGAAYQVPTPVRGERRESLAIRWLVNAARARSNREFHHFYDKLTAEILDALENKGGAIEKKNQMHKMAEANRAFAHFRW